MKLFKPLFDTISLIRASKSQVWQDEMFNRMKVAIVALEKSANQGDEVSQKNLVNVYGGNFNSLVGPIPGIGENLPPTLKVLDLIDEANKAKLPNENKAFKWTKVLADQGDKTSILSLCHFYTKGIGGDSHKAIECYKTLHNEGYPSCDYSLAKIYHYGEGVPINLSEAFKWYEKASNVGYGHHEEAKYELGLMHLNGSGVPKNYNKAKAVFEDLYDNNPTGYWGCGAGKVLNEINN